jgi:hypothetical protein
MASSYSPAKKCVVVLGEMGSGKSHFLGQFCSVDEKAPISSDSSTYVTTKQECFLDKSGKYKLYDTVGLNVTGYQAGLNRQELDGKEVSYVVIISSERWQSQINLLQKHFEWKEDEPNVKFFASWRFKASDTELPSINDFHRLFFDLGALQYKLYSVPKPKLLPPAAVSNDTKQKKHKKNATGVNTQQTKIFPAVVNQALNEYQHRLLQAVRYEQLPPQIPVTPEVWQCLKEQKDVALYNDAGDAHLRYFLRRIYEGEKGGKTTAMEKCENGIYMEVINKVGLKPHIDSLYPNSKEGLSEDTYGDYIEALFEYCFRHKKKRQYVVDILRQIMNTSGNEDAL